jgi:hypothetical protein
MLRGVPNDKVASDASDLVDSSESRNNRGRECGEIGWAHTDVAENNVPRRKLCGALGDTEVWRVVWIRVRSASILVMDGSTHVRP